MKVETISSRDNRRLVEARKVRRGKVEGKILIEGQRLLEEALRSNVHIEHLFWSSDLDAAPRGSYGTTFEVSPSILASIADTETPQGVVAIARRPITAPIDLRTAGTIPQIIFLNEINNPSNLGAVIRTAEAAGIHGVIVSNGSADVFSPKALRAAMGSSFRLPIWENVIFRDAMRWAAENRLTTIAADVSPAASYAAVEWDRPVLVIFGSEAHGLTTEQLLAVDEKIRIPMARAVESLNLAVSAGIILFEAKRQRDGRVKGPR
jgi:TrmH family RNA methyltransferase